MHSPRYLLLVSVVASMVGPLSGQSLDLAVKNVGVSFGDSERIIGLRFNYRDRRMIRVDGINATIWDPYEPALGTVNGIALGLPVAGAQTVNGLAIGLLGAGADDAVNGVGVGLLGVGAGGSLNGIMIGGLGAGAGGNMTGITLAILGAGAGNNIEGLAIAGLAVGAGGDITGIVVGGLAAGAGGTVRGAAIALIAAGAPEVRGLLIGGVASGGQDIEGAALSIAYMTIPKDGELRGLGVSAFNHIKGRQNGLTIGIFNYAQSLNGLQIGLLNFAGNNKGIRRWLPILNWHFD